MTNKMTDDEVLEIVEDQLRLLLHCGATRRQYYDAVTRATNKVFELGTKLPDGPIHLEM